MSYIANQYNYATPLSSVASLFSEQPSVDDKKYFSLFDNVLDGSYCPIDGDVGIWGTSLSDASGRLSSPFVLTITDNLFINAFTFVSSQYSYPTDFNIRFYNGSTLILELSVTENTWPEFYSTMSETLTVTKCEIIVYAVSAPGVPAKLLNVYNPGYVRRSDVLTTTLRTHSDSSALFELHGVDTFSVKSTPVISAVVSNIKGTDNLGVQDARISDYRMLPFCQDTLTAKVSTASEQINNVDAHKDVIRLKSVTLSHILKTLGVGADTLAVRTGHTSSSIINNIEAVRDVCPININAHTSAELTNVHSIMKQPSRHIYGKVYITYTDPMLSSALIITTSGDAYNSVPDQLLDGDYESDGRFFTLYDNNLSGSYRPSNENSQVGWTSSQLSNASGEFDDSAPYIRIDFSERLINSLEIVFDDSHGSIAKNFTVEYVQSNDNRIIKNIVDNTHARVELNDALANVVAVVITVTRVTKAFHPVSILEVPALSTYLYVGYRDRSDLISIDLLEELSYEDEVEALGGISANEVSISIDNSEGDFYFNNTASPVASSLKRNRRIEPWLGIEMSDGEIEWYALGTFWSYKWDVPVESLVAKVVGFDTIGLLDKTDFHEHHVQINKSIGELIEYVLADAKKQLNFLTWKIDEALYDISIPYAWFEASSHTAALRKIGSCYPMHVYCDREGTICAAPQKLHMDFYYDTWSDNTNIIRKDYSSLYTTLPNIISVEVKSPVVKSDVQLADDTLVFDVSVMNTRILNFNEPYISDITVDVACDSTVNYSYEVYSWGIVLNFTGTGTVTKIKCVGSALDISYSSTITARNDYSVSTNGAVKRDISSDFIQRSEHASLLINRILSLSEFDKFDVDVEYRGDISLTINDPIRLLDGIAPDNRYNIRRHELFWNGSLRGSAHLNT